VVSPFYSGVGGVLSFGLTPMNLFFFLSPPRFPHMALQKFKPTLQFIFLSNLIFVLLIIIIFNSKWFIEL
jgi:hypothetical protein